MECKCTMTQKLVGDGCSVCNPALALDHANETIVQIEADLATAEQDSRQKQARIERLEAAVKELREALKFCTDRSFESNIRYKGICALKNTEGA